MLFRPLLHQDSLEKVKARLLAEIDDYWDSPQEVIGLITDAQGIAINESFANFAANDSISNNSYFTQCPILNGAIESASCTLVGLPNATDRSQGVVLNESFAYFANGGVPASYTQCSVIDNQIQSGSCQFYIPSGAGELHNAQQIAINGKYAYFANSVYNGPSYYTQCLVNANGIESQTCTNLIPVAYESASMRGVSFYSLPN